MGADKQHRHRRIRQLLRDERIDTHESLARSLARLGIAVSQSTLSKDLRELGVVRMPQADGGVRYAAAEPDGPDLGVFERSLREYVTFVDRAGNLVVVKTLAGHAQAVCEAVDRMAWPEVMATLAGENTIFVVSRTSAEARALRSRLAALSGAGDGTA